jgi:transcriptional regulator with XRE-family HTH domain
MTAKIVKEIRKELGLNLLEFAQVAGFTSKQHVWSIENKDNKISLFLLDRMVRHLASNGYDIAIDTDIYITFQGKRMKVC